MAELEGKIEALLPISKKIICRRAKCVCYQKRRSE
jgi:hypothetical protein